MTAVSPPPAPASFHAAASPALQLDQAPRAAQPWPPQPDLPPAPASLGHNDPEWVEAFSRMDKALLHLADDDGFAVSKRAIRCQEKDASSFSTPFL